MGLRRLRRSNRRSKLAGRWPHFPRVPPLVPPPALLRANGRATARWLDNVNSFFDYRNNQHQLHHGSRHRRHAGPPFGRRNADSLEGCAGQTLPGPGQEVDPKRPPGTSGPGFCGQNHPQRGHGRGDDRGAGGGRRQGVHPGADQPRGPPRLGGWGKRDPPRRATVSVPTAAGTGPVAATAAPDHPMPLRRRPRRS